MVVADVGSVPIAHQGDPEQVRARIADLGSSALLAFHGDQHVGQLQFRRYEPATKSPNGVWDPLYWMDFDEAPALSSDTLCVFCCHIGQVDDTDARDERYQGRGIAATLLDHFSMGPSRRLRRGSRQGDPTRAVRSWAFWAAFRHPSTRPGGSRPWLAGSTRISHESFDSGSSPRSRISRPPRPWVAAPLPSSFERRRILV